MTETQIKAVVNTAVATPQKQMITILAPTLVSVMAMYLSIGISFGAVPAFIKNELNFGSLVVGLLIGLQPIATLLTRAYAGKITDTLGADVSSKRGIILVLLAGFLYIAAGSLSQVPVLAIAVLAVSRCLHGISESLLVTGTLTWGIGLLGHQNSGKVMTWNGIAMYAGIAIGAPLSIWMVHTLGVVPAFATIIILSFISWFATRELPALEVDPTHVRTPFYKVIGKVAGQGLGLAFASIGFACIASFIALMFGQKGWEGASLGYFCFGGFYILVRVFFSSFPDKFGGLKVALVSFAIELIGQLLIGFSTSSWMAILGCALTGIGFSLVFPSLGVLAIKKIAPQMRGTALGAYAAFFDISLGVAGPAAGAIAGWFGYQAIYFFGAASCLLALLSVLISRKN